MGTDKDLLIRGIRYLTYTVVLMFLAPLAIYQAFRNQEHPLYLPVLIIGLVLAIAAIGLGFFAIRTVVRALFNK
jgi:hypothetical protein